jgi:hypothetical protein
LPNGLKPAGLPLIGFCVSLPPGSTSAQGRTPEASPASLLRRMTAQRGHRRQLGLLIATSQPSQSEAHICSREPPEVGSGEDPCPIWWASMKRTTDSRKQTNWNRTTRTRAIQRRASNTRWEWLVVSSHVRLTVYDMVGREVAILVNGQKKPGSYTVKGSAAGVASGMYFYGLTADDYVQCMRMVLLN